MKKYQLGLYEKALPDSLSWKEKFSACKECGFDYLEMSIDESDMRLSRLEWSREERKNMKSLMDDLGVPIRSICLSGHRKYPLGHPDKKIQEKSLEIMHQAIDLALDLGVRIIQLAGYDVYYEEGTIETEENFIKNLKIAVSMAAKQGIILGFETMETPFMDTVEKSMKYVGDIDSPYLGIYPDIGNLKNASLLYGESVNSDLQKGKGHIFASHLKETKPGIYRDMMFGEGHTDYIENIVELKDQGVCMFVGEFWYQGEEDWKDIVKRSSQFLRDHLDHVFE